MRFAFALVFLGLTAASAAASPEAQRAYVERRGLAVLDERCQLLTPDQHAALQAGIGQARLSLIQSGWTIARLDELDRAASAAARARACDDPRNAEAAARARAGFASFARLPRIEFPGWERNWVALRYPDPAGWRLKQDLPNGAVFGVREADAGQELALSLPLAAGQTAPGSAQLRLRDPQRGAARIDVPGRAQTLAASAPPADAARVFFAAARRIERSASGAQQVVFTFPDAAFNALLLLEPREAIALQIDGGRQLLVEVGDIGAARAFLAVER